MASNPPPSGLVSCHILRCPNNPKGAQFFFHILQGQSPHFELSQRDEGGKERNNLRLFHVSSTLFGLLSCCLCLLRFTFGLLRIFRILHLPYRSLNGSMLGRWHWQCHPPATEAKTSWTFLLLFLHAALWLGMHVKGPHRGSLRYSFD